MSTKPCPHCGGEILETAKFCPLCGKQLPSTEETTRLNEETSFNPVSQPAEPVTQTPPVAPAPQQTTTPPKKNNSKIILLIILGILIAGGVGAGVYFLLVDKPSSSFFDDDDDFYDDDDDDDDDDRDDRYYNDTNVDTGYYIGNVEIVDSAMAEATAVAATEVADDYFLDAYLLTDNDVRHLSKKELRLLRNEIYARHGYIFKSQDLRDYFNRKPWYYGYISNQNDVPLNQTERKNVAMIQKYE